MEIKVVNKEGKETGKKVSLSPEVFGVEPNEHVIWLEVKQFLANQRQGTHKAKERAEVSRTGKKLHRQKGTGGARHGSRRSPIFVGGGTIFGPRPRNYSFKLNKKVKSLAKKSILSERAKEGKVIVVEDFALDTPKTKDYINFLNAVGVNGKSLFVVDGNENNLYLSARNVPKTLVSEKNEVNIYDLVNAENILISENALAHLETILK
ncbi:50S ribosomal protein L4 [Jiulongibacter sediminis]|jgi:large subunit ribosomal protein L4|uniref:Large ribosomal subunit protein uL4 n=1 Tax=Jiulongibacter sediminis TaxID=1605367 RepID=A0A0P7CAY1_9BACT|nr:50S ribosomal protein L4 [Jiulongibacter sediminis]KPM49885.1 50S ribosomal protein L4 [Jiulongibacter sediminis]TBX26922.1 50S ribosomal protein L4 [Jiulongibacter sediminis]